MRESIVAVLVAIIGLAVVAVLVSKNAQTPQVFGAAGSALGFLIQSATSPVTGQPNVSSLGGLIGTSNGSQIGG